MNKLLEVDPVTMTIETAKQCGKCRFWKKLAFMERTGVCLHPCNRMEIYTDTGMKRYIKTCDTDHCERFKK